MGLRQLRHPVGELVGHIDHLGAESLWSVCRAEELDLGKAVVPPRGREGLARRGPVGPARPCLEEGPEVFVVCDVGCRQPCSGPREHLYAFLPVVRDRGRQATGATEDLEEASLALR